VQAQLITVLRGLRWNGHEAIRFDPHDDLGISGGDLR
jgi:hypothetical protein